MCLVLHDLGLALVTLTPAVSRHWQGPWKELGAPRPPDYIVSRSSPQPLPKPNGSCPNTNLGSIARSSNCALAFAVSQFCSRPRHPTQTHGSRAFPWDCKLLSC
ncbi:hypothetical protein L209DRAFT_760324 [Thermothelomyces heterothallicus CBS 203.75]